jgi:hypothetical protein
MRKLLPLLSAIAVTAALMPAHAKTLMSKQVTFAANPCAAICAYQVPFPTDPNKVSTFDPKKFDATKYDPTVDPTAQACTEPFPAGGYKDVVVRAPKGAHYLIFAGTPTVDWDLFVCAKPHTGNNGPMIAYSANSDLQACQVGCAERAFARVVQYRYYVLRAYNYSDPDSLVATYRFAS